MAVMAVGRMGMGMAQSSVDVLMRVRLTRRITWTVSVLMVLVMGMPVAVFRRFVLVLVLVSLLKVEPDADPSQFGSTFEGTCPWGSLTGPPPADKAPRPSILAGRGASAAACSPEFPRSRTGEM